MSLDNLNNLFENKIIMIYFIIILIIISIFIIPNLSKNILFFFNNVYIKIIFIILIFYISNINFQLSIILLIIYFLILYQINKNIIHMKFINEISNSMQITSDNKINLINNLLLNPNINNSEKKKLEDSIFNSIASDRHKFNTGLILLDNNSIKKSSVIKKLYNCNMKPHNILKMTDRLIEKKLKDKDLIIIIKQILKINLDNNIKKTIINKIVEQPLKDKSKKYILKKIDKSSDDFKDILNNNNEINNNENNNEIKNLDNVNNNEIKNLDNVNNNEIKNLDNVNNLDNLYNLDNLDNYKYSFFN